jgi:hypothetical protein
MKGVIPDKFAKQTISIMQINVDKMKGLRVIELVQVYLFNRSPLLFERGGQERIMAAYPKLSPAFHPHFDEP